MGIVVRFPRHVRASSWVRAAKAVKISAERPAAFAVSVPKITLHHSAGTASRCHHFETAEARAPMSDAIASREAHSSIMERNVAKDAKSVMSESIGQTVLKGKAIASLDCELPIGHNVRMARKILTDFECRFLARTYAARKLKFETQEEIAASLQTDMKQDTYKQYEVRGPLPYELIDRFLKLTGVSYEWLFTGRGPGPAWQDRYQKLLEKQNKPKKARKAA